MILDNFLFIAAEGSGRQYLQGHFISFIYIFQYDFAVIFHTL